MSYSEYTTYSLDPLGRPRFYGIYRGNVVDNVDPQSKNRLGIVVPQVTGSDRLSLVEACLPPVSGAISLPEVGSNVWVMFESGDPSYPVWIGVK